MQILNILNSFGGNNLSFRFTIALVVKITLFDQKNEQKGKNNEKKFIFGRSYFAVNCNASCFMLAF